MSWATANILVTSAAYLVCTVFYTGYLMRLRGQWLRGGQSAFTVALVLHGVASVHLWAEGAHDGSLVAWFAVAGSFVAASLTRLLAPRLRFEVLGAFVAPVVAVVLFSGWVGVQQGRPVSPQVFGVLTPVHIVASVLGVAAFLVAFGASALLVVRDADLRQRRPSAWLPRASVAGLERLTSRALAVGFPIYTVGVVLGGVWAARGGVEGFSGHYALAVLSWVVYGALLHGRMRLGWRGRRAALVNMLGFVGAFAVVVYYAARATG